MKRRLFLRGVAAMKDWDWRTAGRTKIDEGSFVYGENLIPHYAWLDGQMHYPTIDTKLDPATQPIPIDTFAGRQEDPNTRIWPFKRKHTVPPYDAGNNTLVYT
jgi:hypothetical protein